MAIQFLCAACGQPIEVDDEAANQVVTCPYCRKVVTAPATSDTTVNRGIPDARTSIEPGPENLVPASPVASGNRIGWAALACVTVMILCIIIAMAMQFSLFKSEGLLDQPNAEKIKQFVEEQQKHPGPATLRIANLSYISFFFGLLSFVMGIIGVIGNRRPKWPAIITLVICTLLILFMCIVLWIAASSAARRGMGAG